MERFIPEIGTPLYLQQRTGSYYVDQVKTPYTVIGYKSGKVIIQSCKMTPPVYHCVGNPHLDRPDLEGKRVWFYDTVAETIEPDPNGETLELNWSPKHETWQIDQYHTGYPDFAHFGKYEYFPYLD